MYILTHNTELEGLDYGGWVAVVGDALVLPAVTKDDKIINSFVKKINRVWLLTGTPMTSRPINYYNLLSII